jgi:D-alanyl-D-alanine dipeptidase
MTIKHVSLIVFSIISFSISAQAEKTIDDVLVNLKTTSDEFFYDIRYATDNNFLKSSFYDCPNCYLQPDVAEALYLANQYFCELGYYIKLYDCYRPIAKQKLMWAAYPNPMYVANPYTKGSIHSRGAAVDLTLVDERGCELDMGTPYDFFGRAAHIDHTNLPKEVLQNRKLLQEGLKKFGFLTIRTEWWHFSYKANYRYKALDLPFACQD